MDEQFITHGYYTLGNAGGYEVMLNDYGDAARIREAFGGEYEIVTDWLDIEYVMNEETDEWEPVIDPDNYRIPLNAVIRTIH